MSRNFLSPSKLKIDMRILAVVLPANKEHPTIALTFRHEDIQRKLIYNRLDQVCAVRNAHYVEPEIDAKELMSGAFTKEQICAAIPIPPEMLEHLITAIDSILDHYEEDK